MKKVWEVLEHLDEVGDGRDSLTLIFNGQVVKDVWTVDQVSFYIDYQTSITTVYIKKGYEVYDTYDASTLKAKVSSGRKLYGTRWLLELNQIEKGVN